MNGHEKSHSAIVAVKPTNKAGRPVAEPVEPRAGSKGSAKPGDTLWTPSQESASYGRMAYGKAARGGNPIRPRHSLHRQPPEVGTVCPNWARTGLCGGRSAMGVPTAIRNRP